MNLKFLFVLFIFFSCYKVDPNKVSIPIIKDIPDGFDSFENDYSINDLVNISKIT